MNYSKFNKSKFSTSIYELIKECSPDAPEELFALKEIMRDIIDEEARNYAWDCKEMDDEAYKEMEHD